MIVRPARAKLNLYLRIVGRRDDGYHLLDSLVAFCDLADEVAVAPAGELTLTIDGPLAGALAAEPVADNLVLRAARALAGRAGVSAKAALRLTKRIPVAAGLGGGSADAAATLLALIELWRLAMPEEELFDLAATLGADVPMCLAVLERIPTARKHRHPERSEGSPRMRPSLPESLRCARNDGCESASTDYALAAQVSGVGERVGPAVALPPAGLLLVNPGTPLPTPPVFAAYARSGRRHNAAAALEAPPSDVVALGRLLTERGNDLTDAATSLVPEIDEVLGALWRTSGCRVAQMSGSGATCFALYDDIAAAGVAMSEVRRDHPAWWSHAGILD